MPSSVKVIQPDTLMILKFLHLSPMYIIPLSVNYKTNTQLQSYIECMLWHSRIAIQIIPNQTNESTMMYIKQQ